ncbi:sensor histidine kinase [Mycolicibacterium thermoresistibile]
MTPVTRRRSRLTVQGWQNVVLSIMGVVVLAGAVAGWLLLHRTDEMTREVKNNIQPARVAAYQLQSALRDQETAVRSYALTADPDFLTPYDDALLDQQAAAEELRRLVGDHPELMTDLDNIERNAESWRSSYVVPLLDTVTPDDDPALARMVERERVEFDRMRALFDVQNDHLTEVRQAAVDELDRNRAWRNAVLIAMVTAFFVTAALLAVLVRATITRPLDELAASCRRITEGNFGERITLAGPKDIQAIATDVDNMRQRIVDELESSHSAHSQLSEQADALDQQAEELRRSNAELEQFAYVASHDLQEPLRKVASFCQLLEKRYGDQLDDRGAEYIKFAVDGAKRMQVLINDLLTFSRVGRLNATETPVSLDAALDAALNNLSTAVEESGTDIVRPDELPTITGDPTLLTMLWQNLIGNAVKFKRPDQTPRVVIECAKQPTEGEDQWLVTVSDNGIGIADEFVDKVFVIFQRLHGRDTYTGTGIGLALCKKIVEHHGGTIWIDTDYTGGARFRFTLPVTSTETASAVLEGVQE